LPDFVWSCGNSEVMAFVRSLVAENAALRRKDSGFHGGPSWEATEDGKATSSAKGYIGEAPEAMAMDSPRPARSGSPLASALFDTRQANMEVALAFVSTVGENDGHQIRPLVELLGEFNNNARGLRRGLRGA